MSRIGVSVPQSGTSLQNGSPRHICSSLRSPKAIELEERGNFISIYSFGKHEGTEVRVERVLQKAFDTKVYSANSTTS